MSTKNNNNPDIFNGELVQILLAGGQIVCAKRDRKKTFNLRLLVRCPDGKISEDGRKILFQQFQSLGGKTYECGTDYFCNLSRAKKRFEEDVREDRAFQLMAEQNKDKSKKARK